MGETTGRFEGRIRIPGSSSGRNGSNLTRPAAAKGPGTARSTRRHSFRLLTGSGMKRPSARLLRGAHLAEAGIPEGKLWAIIVAQSEEAQDEGAFSDEAGVKEWLATNEAEIMQEAAPPAESRGGGREEECPGHRERLAGRIGLTSLPGLIRAAGCFQPGGPWGPG